MIKLLINYVYLINYVKYKPNKSLVQRQFKIKFDNKYYTYYGNKYNI